MKFADRVKESTTATSMATIALAGAATGGFRTFASSFAVGASGIPVGVDDGAGNWENGTYTLTSAALLTREQVTSSSSGNQAVAFGAGSKNVVCTLTAASLAAIPQSSDIAFSTTIPLDTVGQVYMPRTKVAAGMAFTAAAGAVRGALAYLKLLGDGANTPTFSGMLQWGGSLDFNPTSGIENQVQVFCDGTSVFYSITSAVNAQPIATPATAITLSGPSGGVVSTASSAFTAGTNGSITGTVVVTPSDGVGGTFSPSTVSLTSANPTATFTYTPGSTGSKTVNVTNNGALSNPAGLAYTVSAAATVPGAPVVGTAVGGNASASVAFTAPSNNGGAAIIDYTVTASPGGATATGTASPISVTGLTNGTAYTFTVKARNSVGSSAASAASNSITPAIPYARLNSLNNVTETGSGPYSYQGASGNWLNGAGGVTNPLASGADGSVAFGINALNSSVGLLIGVTTGSTKVPYSGTLMAVYPDTQGSNNYNTITNGDAGGRQDSGVTAQVGDILRLRRSGSSFIAEYARSATPTTFSTLRTWTGQPTGQIYFQVDVTGAGTVAQNLAGVGIV